MGTNYYASAEPCPHCGRGDTEIHIGKSSGGWKFLFRADAGRGLTSWAAWKAYLSQPGVDIGDEYGKAVSLADLEALVEAKQSARSEEEYTRPDDAGYRFSIFPEFS